MKVLFTGFEAFEQGQEDSSWKWIAEANEQVGEEHLVHSLKLPATWDGCFSPLRTQLNQGWDAVICMGAKKCDSIAIERLALNEADVSFKDAEGRRPRNKTIDTDGEPGYWSALPYRELGINLTAANLPAAASHSAGKGLPNCLFYQLMNWMSFSRRKFVGGLIQVPQDDRLLMGSSSAAKTFVRTVLETLGRTADQDDSLMVDLSRFEQLRESPRP